ncbi:type I-E CRISPR-associated endoribonuclease Cas2 [Streptomyces nogalater]
MGAGRGQVVGAARRGRALPAYHTDNEQGFTFRTHDHAWHPTDHEGLTLLHRPSLPATPRPTTEPPATAAASGLPRVSSPSIGKRHTGGTPTSWSLEPSLTSSRPRPGRPAGRAGAAGRGRCSPAGAVTRVIWPAWAVTRAWAMARPRPEPPVARVRESSVR